MPIRAVEGLRVCEAVHTFKEIDVFSCFRAWPPRAQLSAGAVAFEIRVNPVMVPGKLRVFNGI
jgi:hypothetical protein